jgi:phosphate transport system substrate-binding protein
MNRMRTWTKRLMIPAFGLAVLVVSGCGDSAQTPVIKIDGSSTVYPVAQAVAENFQKAKKVRVTVAFSGTSGGFQKFARGDTAISNASRPITKKEMESLKQAGIEYIELPICFDALTVAVHPKNDWCTSITIAELKKMWEPASEGKITRWNQIRPDWPKQEFALYGAGAQSGTFDYFTEAIVGKAKDSRTDYTPSEDDNELVQGVGGNKYALGYIPYAYYEPNQDKIKAVPIAAEKGKGPVEPNMDNVLKGNYPLSRPLFIYVSNKAAERPEVKEFVEYFLTEGPKLVEEIKYLPLPQKAYDMGLERFRKRQAGTGFGGKPAVNKTVEEILQMTPKS